MHSRILLCFGQRPLESRLVVQILATVVQCDGLHPGIRHGHVDICAELRECLLDCVRQVVPDTTTFEVSANRNCVWCE